METRSDLTRELVRSVRKREVPADYAEIITAVLSYGPITRQEERMPVDTSAIRMKLDNWSSGWMAALQPEPTHTRVRQRFTSLADVWRRETAFESSVTRRAIHWSYQQIIGMGPVVLPLILEELRSDEDDWFWALTAIAGEDVARGAETLTEATHRWLAWASDHQITSATIG
jgi:hypothetical protein